MPRGRKETLILSRLVRPTLVSGLAASEMDSVSSSGQMVHDTRASGKIIELTAKVNLRILMVISTRETG